MEVRVLSSALVSFLDPYEAGAQAKAEHGFVGKRRTATQRSEDEPAKSETCVVPLDVGA